MQNRRVLLACRSKSSCLVTTCACSSVSNRAIPDESFSNELKRERGQRVTDAEKGGGKKEFTVQVMRR